MARSRGNAEKPATDTNVEAPEETVVAEATDTPSTEGADASAEATTEGTDTKAEPDLTAFQAAVESAVEKADAQTGILPDGALTEPNAEYSKLPGAKGKGLAKKWLGQRMQELLMSGIEDPAAVGKARAYMNLQNSLAASKSPETRAPADPTEAHVEHVAAITIAYQLLSEAPEGVKEGWMDLVTKLVNDNQEKVAAYKTWVDNTDEAKGDAPEVPAVVTRAFKIAAGKAAGARKPAGPASPGHTGPRRSIEAHIASAFADKKLGDFMTIAEIVKAQSEEYGTDKPSAGAVSVRLFPKTGKCNLTGVEPATQDGKRGARKVAVAA